jgi:hypothetical protein
MVMQKLHGPSARAPRNSEVEGMVSRTSQLFGISAERRHEVNLFRQELKVEGSGIGELPDKLLTKFVCSCVPNLTLSGRTYKSSP